MLKSFGVVCLCCAFLPAQIAGPERKVQSNVVTSERDPKVQVRLPQSAQYVGADRFVLYDIADCELHAFVEVDEHKNVKRLYWVQFEGYLPTRPELQHTYDSPRHASMDGLDFFVDTWVAGERRSDASGVGPRAHREDHSWKGIPPAGRHDVRAAGISFSGQAKRTDDHLC